jgi:hypothetical protein
VKELKRILLVTVLNSHRKRARSARSTWVERERALLRTLPPGRNHEFSLAPLNKGGNSGRAAVSRLSYETRQLDISTMYLKWRRTFYPLPDNPRA